MRIPIYQVDAFASRVFAGNPAAVCPLDAWPDDGLLQGVAAENNLSETAFLVPADDGFELRWFTPACEVELCGHATLASAFVLFERRGWTGESIRFHTRWSGDLVVGRCDGRLEMDFPSRPPRPVDVPADLEAALGARPERVLGSVEDLLVVLPDERTVRRLEPDMAALGRLEWRGVIVTARGGDCDLVSRFFGPQVGIPEDPVTGSAHCVLTPYWSEVLGRKELRARQVSRRGGEILCRDRGERVLLAGEAALYLEGRIEV